MTPKIRLKGFDEPWKRRKLGDYLEVSGEKNTGLRYGVDDVYSVSWAQGVVNQIEFQGRSYAGADLSNYDVIRTDDVVYTKSPLGDEPYGIVKSNKGEPGIVSQLYAVYHPKAQANPHFVEVYFSEVSRLNEYFRPLVNKGAKNTMNISDETSLGGEVSFPGYEEQCAIAELFSTLDQLVDLHQRELDKLRSFRQAILQKMFPQDGAAIPEIRFAGFAGPWEQRKLEELLFFQNGYNGSSESFGSGTPLISVMDILADGFITHDTIRGKAQLDADEMKRFSVEYGDVLFQRSSENYEDAGTSNVYLDQHVPASFGGFVIRGKRIAEYDPVFIKYLLGSKPVRNQITHRAQGAQHINVSQDTLADVLVHMPGMREQEAVGSALFNLDNLITLHQRELDKLKSFRQAMLQKMFP